jgi:Pyruvate/2-oxoacid:ferredoxin oxidoreductase delta subunit
MTPDPYRKLAQQLDALPNGFPATASGVELRLLATFFSAEEAALAAQLRETLETPQQIADRIGGDPKILRLMLKGMLQRGVIRGDKVDGGLGLGLRPFVVGIYEALLGQISAEQAALFEEYYHEAFGRMLDVQPPLHRVIPVNESIRVDMEVHPYESAANIVDGMQSWGVIDCICRKQKAEIGDPCHHPVDVCLILSEWPSAFEGHPRIQSLSHEEAVGTLQRAARAGLVHSVSNNQQGLHYICNCCTCSCGILRGMADLGLANVVARAAFVNQVDEDLCIGCELCLPQCQFDALALNELFMVKVNEARCVGCGVCVSFCDEEALGLVRRPESDVKSPPPTIMAWGRERAMARGLDMLDKL